MSYINSNAVKSMTIAARSAMNTIPSIFKEVSPSYTVVGGKERLGATGLCAVVLNKPGHCSRWQLFEELEKIGFDYVISIEKSSERYDLEDLANSFPFVSFIIPHENLNIGRQINLAVRELDSPMFFVLWNDLKFVAGGTARRMAERLEAVNDEDNSENKKNMYCKRLCTVPVIQNSRFETIPSLAVPVIVQKKVQTMPLIPNTDGMPALYPFEGIGIYDRERFIRVGGFDSTLSSKHWQLMDFGFRSHLWGENISVSQQIKMSYDGVNPPEDNTAEDSYRRFYFKNLAPVWRSDHAHLPLRGFLAYIFSSHGDLLASWEEFAESRRWVKDNSFRWKCGVRELIGKWNSVTEASSPAC